MSNGEQNTSLEGLLGQNGSPGESLGRLEASGCPSGLPGYSGRGFWLVLGLHWDHLSDPRPFLKGSCAPFSVQDHTSNAIVCFWKSACVLQDKQIFEPGCPNPSRNNLRHAAVFCIGKKLVPSRRLFWERFWYPDEWRHLQNELPMEAARRSSENTRPRSSGGLGRFG